MDDPLAVLLLPARLEEFEFAAHARDLLEIERVVAVEPRRERLRPGVAEALAGRHARRLRFPGVPRVLVIYRPLQYPLARALSSRHEDTELWYLRAPESDHAAKARDLARLEEFDRLAEERAARTLSLDLYGEPRAENEALRQRLTEVGVISFLPMGARVERK
jgi:hypothetical protein